MATSTAKVIDLQSYRADREARLRPPAAEVPANATSMPFAWVPIWVMPVYFVGSQPTAVTD